MEYCGCEHVESQGHSRADAGYSVRWRTAETAGARSHRYRTLPDFARSEIEGSIAEREGICRNERRRDRHQLRTARQESPGIRNQRRRVILRLHCLSSRRKRVAQGCSGSSYGGIKIFRASVGGAERLQPRQLQPDRQQSQRCDVRRRNGQGRADWAEHAAYHAGRHPFLLLKYVRGRIVH